MDPQRLLQRMCRRHGIPYDRVTHLVPLVERALGSPAEARDRILRLVDNNLALRVGGAPQKPVQAQSVAKDLDGEVLLSVARVLHAWEPSPGVLKMGGAIPGLFPDGLEGLGIEDLEDEPSDDEDA